ncbi:hypothetical protein AGMMS50212_11010 [Spirochaetia bacterium]|nr:hypothetical protein AGMMS50212_11010 [Spirochaetia bacterium]
MKKRITVKILELLVLYCAVFFLLAFVQFARMGSFNHSLGDLRISGSFQKDSNIKQRGILNVEYPIEDGVSVVFGGMEFILSSTHSNGLAKIDLEGNKIPLSPVAMIPSNEAVRFKLSDGQEVSFYVQGVEGRDELIISGVIDPVTSSINIPFKPLKKTKIIKDDAFSFLVRYNNQDYTFDRDIIDIEEKTIAVSHNDPVVAYRILPEEHTFNPVEYIISGAMQKTRYDEILVLWCDNTFAAWEKQVFAGGNDETLIMNYVAEAARRGSLHSAVDNIPASFRNSPNRTYRSSPFLGRLDIALRSIVAAEREKTDELTSILKDNPIDFLRKDWAFEYLAQRSNDTLFKDGINFINSLPPERITSDLCAGIFEGWITWDTWNKDTYNPFNKYVEICLALMADDLIKTEEGKKIFVMQGNSVDVMYNLRLGIAVTAYGEACSNSEWAAVGRSIVLSCLDLTTEKLELPEKLEFSGQGFVPAEKTKLISSVNVYPMLRLSDFYPHTVGAGTVMRNVWIWTMSPAIGASFTNGVLDFGIRFPLNQPHYLFILGLRPFSKIQMRDMDYRSDPQFEDYNSPGWAYSASERVMMVKLINKTDLEHIKIFF